jgi:hypothetical protein
MQENFLSRKETYDFGKIPKGTPVNHEFNFTNNGKEPIVISKCTGILRLHHSEVAQEPILPAKLP